MKCIDQRNKAIKILGTFVSYNDGIKGESNFLKVGSNVQALKNSDIFEILLLKEK